MRCEMGEMFFVERFTAFTAVDGGRIYMAAVPYYFVMQMRSGRTTRGANAANALPLGDALALFDEYFAQVGIAGAIAFGMFYFYE